MISRRPILFPGADTGWEVYRKGTAGKSRFESPKDAGKGVIFAVPSSHCRTIVVTLPTGDESLFKDMIRSQLEKRGLVGERGEPLFDYQVLNRSDTETQVSVDILSADLPAELQLPGARAYVSAARALALPDHKLVLWREHGNIVLSAGSGGQTAFSAVVSRKGGISEEVAGEVKMISMGLQADGVIDKVSGVELWGDGFSRECEESLRRVFEAPVSVVSHPPGPRIPAGADRLVPSFVERSRRSRRRVWFGLLLLLLLAGLYAVLFKKMKGELERLEAAVPSLEQRAGETQGQADGIKRSGERWQAFRQVVEPKRYPLMHFKHLTRMLPAEGVIIDSFETKISEVKVQGRARTARMAFSYLEAVQKCADLDLYGWGMAQPRVRQDGSVRFEIKAKLK